ncbi:MAG: IS110 family transposase [Bradyrhizobium sp.]|uniref:IS110 family transposase n=1 Tax=Bradyrhizobium sp. TaxID=376 RepID=UPI0025BF2A19|nr:IS110 family transposase [Bradyrhizobium sp.]MBI5261904.1 IS110 family transposase [Bradyrhizobium sp.]
MEEELKVFVGIDWGREEHQVCVLDALGKVIFERKIVHEVSALRKIIDEVIGLAGGDPAGVGVAIEVPHGVIVETLVDADLKVFSINPKQLDRFRDRFTVAGAKDDRRDAHALASALRTDRRAFWPVAIGAPKWIELREESHNYEDLRADFTRLTNRLRELVTRYYGQLLTIGDVTEPWIWELFERAPDPQAAQKIRLSSIEIILRRHHIRRIGADEVREKLRAASFTAADGVREGVVRRIESLLPQLRAVMAQLKESQRNIDRLLDRCGQADTEDVSSGQDRPPDEHSDVAILRSLPGVGRIVSAAVLAEAHAVLLHGERSTLRALGGIAPVTKRSGKSLLVVQRRRACNPRLSNAFYHWGRTAVQHDEHCRQHYARLRQRGHGHARAIRGVVDRLLDVLLRMLKDRTLYDANRRTAAPLVLVPAA